MHLIDYHIPVPPAMLQEVIDKAEGAEAAKEEKTELEELKQLLPEITEKIEDAKEGQRTAPMASEAIHQTLVSCFMHLHYCPNAYCSMADSFMNSISACILCPVLII